MGQPIRILQVVTYMGRGGLETMLMNYYRQIDRSRVQFDFLTHRAEPADYDKEIKGLGGKIYHLPRLVPWSPSYRRALAR
ncbi:MAG TPA: glycosyltransferase family 1 protein, partial [Candidatus Intestinimonas stercoravium]|nr:glycosyltransferase family 1 protein [Candidatus Intestinimonas stercoravium]